jgi:hypothetical protein
MVVVSVLVTVLRGSVITNDDAKMMETPTRRTKVVELIIVAPLLKFSFVVKITLL